MHPKYTLASPWQGRGHVSAERGAELVGEFGPRVAYGSERLQSRGVLELVHHVAVPAQREPRIVPELPGHVDLHGIATSDAEVTNTGAADPRRSTSIRLTA
jgi:hypothetical protein